MGQFPMTLRRAIAFAAFIAGTSVPCQDLVAQQDVDYRAQRSAMVDRYVIAAGVTNPRVIAALRATPRHEFVPVEVRRDAYRDVALPIGSQQTISSPYIVARMTERIDPQPTDRVLEVGTGSGYQAAVLSPLVKEVYTIEIVPELGKRAARKLLQLGYQNVFAKVGDGYQGWTEKGPFDKIVVTCSPEEIPTPLVDQLAEGGHLVIPVGERFQQTLYRFTKVNGALQKERLEPTFFVPMTGQAELERKVLPDGTHPTLVNGSFEDTYDDTREPVGWYYVRGGKVQGESQAPGAQRCIHFVVDELTHESHALQSFGVDGRHVRKVQLSLWSRGLNIRQVERSKGAVQMVCEFYGENRQPVKLIEIPVRTGSFDWAQQKKTILVPSEARLAIVGVGLMGGTGELSVDLVELDVIADQDGTE